MSGRQKKVLIVIPSLRRGGGAQHVAAFIANHLSPEIRVSVLTFKRHREEYEVSDRRIVYPDQRILNGWFSKAQDAWGRARHVQNVAEEEQVDTILGFVKGGGVPAVLSKMFGSTAKIIVAIRNNPRAKFENWNGRLAVFLYTYADQVVTNSRASERICRTEYGLEHTSTIYNPVDYERVKKKSQQVLPAEYNALFREESTFINIGRLDPQKGQWHLIRAFSQVVQDHPEAQLLILGEGELREQLERLIGRCGLEDHVHLPGRKENVFPFLNAADCFVLSSLHEGLPNVLLEARAVGLPVISVDCDTGPREILAPDSPLDADRSYPHTSGRHCIVEPVSGKHIFEPPSECALESAERMLARVMKRKLNNGFSKRAFEEDDRFQPEHIIEEWKKIL